MFGSLLSAASRSMGAARGHAMQFLGPRNFGRDYYQAGMMSRPPQSAGGGMSAMAWLSSAAKDATKGLMSVGAVSTAGMGAVKALEAFSTSLLKSRENLALFHGGIAAAFSRMDRQDMTLQLRRAQATAPGVTRFADAVMQMREDTLQARILMDSIWNSIGTGMATIVSFVSRVAEPTLKQISEFLVEKGIIEPSDPRNGRLQGDLADFLGAMKRGEFGQPINQRPNPRDRR